MKVQITTVIELDTETGITKVLGQPNTLLIDSAVDLLGVIHKAPKKEGRTGIDKELTTLIDFFRNHPARRTSYIPNWAKDKVHLRPYVEAKGSAMMREMLDAFICRDYYAASWKPPEVDFNVRRVMDAPLTIQAFIGIADCLDVLLRWETTEEPYGG